jgi:NitT/TauT family transport system substrate-binding protein
MTPKLRCLAAILGAAVALTLAGCGGNGSTPDPAANSKGLEKTTIKVGVLPIPDVAALHIANAKGFFKDEGLTVEPVTITGGAAALPQVKSGALDISQINYVSTFLAASKGEKIKLIADMYQAAPNTFVILVPKDSPITNVAGLKGKTVLVNNLNNIATLAVTMQLKAAGLTASDVKFAEKPFPDMGNALSSGQADAAWINEPYISANTQLGMRSIADTMTGPMQDFPIAGWMATAEWTQKYPKTLAAFQRGLAKAQDIARADRKEVEAVLPTYTKIDAKTAAAIKMGVYPNELNAARLQKVVDLMVANQYLTSPIDVQSILAPPPSG